MYLCTGSPLPADIETVVNAMLADEFLTAYTSTYLATISLYTFLTGARVPVINALKAERGLALQDLLIGAAEYVETIQFPAVARVYLLDAMATTEYVLLSMPLKAVWG